MTQIEYPFDCSLIVVQPTPFCNLACEYCYLRDKDTQEILSAETLHIAMEQVLQAGIINSKTTLVWHAGEPLSLPINHFENLLKTVEKIDKNNFIRFHIQTNATTINDRWCKLFNDYNISIGVSLDGPQHIHDARRVDRKGQGSFNKTYRGLKMLIEAGIEPHVIAVLTNESLEHTEEILSFFSSLGVSRIGFNIEEVEGVNQDSSAFRNLNRVSKFWQEAHKLHIDKSEITIREFERVYQYIASSPENKLREVHFNMNEQVRPLGIICIDYLGNYSTFSPEILGQDNQDYNNFIFGNAQSDESNFEALLNDEYFLKTFKEIHEGVNECAQTCQYFSFCGGGSPSNKLYENGSFSSAETNFCKTMIKTPFDIVLNQLENAFN